MINYLQGTRRKDIDSLQDISILNLSTWQGVKSAQYENTGFKAVSNIKVMFQKYAENL